MDPFLIIITIVLAILLTFSSFYLLVLYCHPDDRGWGTSAFCRILVIVGMTFSWAQVLILPLDVANSRGTGAGFDMQTFWYFIYISVAVLVSILIPFAQFMYETDDEKPISSRIGTALCYEACLFILIAIVYFVSYVYLRFADIPVVILQNTGNFTSSSTPTIISNIIQKKSSMTLQIPVSFAIYIMAFTGFIGNWLFVLFAGVGLFAFPLDMILAFLNRPIIRKSSEALEIKNNLKQQTQSLINIKCADELTDEGSYWSRLKQMKAYEKKFNEFRVGVLSLERDHEIFKLELSIVDTNPVIWILKLCFGGLLFLVSLTWWLHIIIYVLAPGTGKFPQYPFLNKVLTGLEQSGVSFLGTAIFAFLSLYMLWCVQKGNLKFGLRIPFIFTIHPMIVNETWMNSFLFNINLVLICSVSVCQFCSKAFSQYTRLTTIDLIFNNQVRHMKFFGYFYNENVFEYVLVIWSALTCIYLIFRSSDQPKALKQIEEMRKVKIK